MADVDSVVYTTTERKVRKVKKTTKRRESQDQNASEVTITEVDSTGQNHHHAIEEYVLADDTVRQTRNLAPFVASFLLLLTAVRRRSPLPSSSRVIEGGYRQFSPPRGNGTPRGASTPFEKYCARARNRGTNAGFERSRVRSRKHPGTCWISRTLPSVRPFRSLRYHRCDALRCAAIRERYRKYSSVRRLTSQLFSLSSREDRASLRAIRKRYIARRE